MTDKQIIIDDVDVSGCGKYHYKGCMAYDFVQCESLPNCIFKQLARKTKKLKESLTKINEMSYILHEYKLSFESARGCAEYMLKQSQDETTKYYTKIILNYLNMRYEEIKKFENFYEQALEKILEIATDLRTRTDYHSEDEVNADIDMILNIINEVKNAR